MHSSQEVSFQSRENHYPNRIAESAQDAYTTCEVVYREPARERIQDEVPALRKTSDLPYH